MMSRPGKALSFFALVFAFTSAAVLVAPEAVEGKEDKDRDRVRFYGWVEYMPEGFHGTWIIGGQQITTNPRTQFDQREGPLTVGGCAKVDIRGGAVHEIDSEPLGNCR